MLTASSGFKNPSPFAPEEGYQFSGLYKCVKAWMDTSPSSNLLVCRTAFVRLPGQPPLPIKEGREDEAAALLAEARAQMSGNAEGDNVDAGPSSPPSLVAAGSDSAASDSVDEAVTSDMDVDEEPPVSSPSKAPRVKRVKVAEPASLRRSPRKGRAIVA